MFNERAYLAGASVVLDRVDNRADESWHALEQSHCRGCMATRLGDGDDCRERRGRRRGEGESERSWSSTATREIGEQ